MADNENIWLIDDKNDGLPRLVDTAYEVFTDWPRDKWGYPLNPLVWKLDDNNEGLPWISGFPQSKISYLQFYKMN